MSVQTDPSQTGTTAPGRSGASSSRGGGTGTLSQLAELAGAVLKDGKVDANDVPAIGNAALGMLGVTMDAAGAANSSPLGQLLQLVVSKIRFLQEPLDRLLGSAELVQQQSEAWTQVAATFTEAGKDHATGRADLRSWTGAAATEYRRVQESTSTIFPAAAQGATSMSVVVVKAGQLVAEVRAFIWDLLVSFLRQAIQSALSALAAAAGTFGSSILAFAGWFLGKTASLASRFAGLVQRLLKAAAALAAAIKQQKAKLDEAATLMRQFTQGLAAGPGAPGAGPAAVSA